MYILELINEIKNSKDCFVYPPCGIPVIGENVKLPSDLKKFPPVRLDFSIIKEILGTQI